MKTIINIPEIMERLTVAIESQANSTNTVDSSVSPGSKKIYSGNRNAGFIGFVNQANFITPTALTTQLGFSTFPIHSDSNWIKYIWKGNICFTPLFTIYQYITWEDLYSQGLVFGSNDVGINPVKCRIGTTLHLDNTDNSINALNQHFVDFPVGNVGDILVLSNWSNSNNNGEVTIVSITNDKIIVSGKTLSYEIATINSKFYNKTTAVIQNKTVTINGLTYKVRLFKGISQDTFQWEVPIVGENNEWNWIMGQLNELAKSKKWSGVTYMDQNLGDFDISLTKNNIGTEKAYCQESNMIQGWTHVQRGGDVDVSSFSTDDGTQAWYGYRPVLFLDKIQTL